MQHLLLLICLFPLYLSAQTMQEKTEAVLKLPPRNSEKYSKPAKKDLIFLETAFNNAVFTDKIVLNSVKDKVILKIELVYTTYRKSETFDQHGLSRKRLENLFLAAPNCLNQSGIEWVLLAQTGCKSAEEGANYFHGFVITYRDLPDPVSTKVESNFLREVTAGKVKSYAYDTYLKKETEKLERDSLENVEPVIVLPQFPHSEQARINYFSKYLNFPAESAKPAHVDVQFLISKEGKITKIIFPNSNGPSPYKDEISDFIEHMPDWTPGTLNGRPTECMVKFSVDFMGRGSVIPSPLEIFATEVPPKLKPKLPAFDYNSVKPTPTSNQVTKSLTKVDWSKAVLVCDVTGSMAPFNAQVIEFIASQMKNRQQAPKQFVFFNDGDNRKDKSKKIGQTGGIYPYTSTSLDSISETMISAMSKGSGGDLPENNVEALMKAQEKYPQTQRLILIADNYASPRDMSLVKNITVPVHVVVCGGSILNEDYLDLAYQTKGSLSFNGTEYTDFHTFEEGATMQIGKMTYVLKKGHFIPKRV
ncbi:hypothetical protein D3C87_39800 [compost metagenome]